MFLLEKNSSHTVIFTKVMIFSLFMSLNINISHASLITVKVEDSNVMNWDPIQKTSPGFGSNGPVSLNWDPYNSFFTELLAYNRGYSEGAAAFCWYGENCGLQLSVTDHNAVMQLKSFSLGYYGYGNYVKYNVIDLANDITILSGSPWVDGIINSLIEVNASSDTGFLILFGPDGFNGGINNISYDYQSYIAATPVPTAFLLFGTGLIGLMFPNRLTPSSRRWLTVSRQTE